MALVSFNDRDSAINKLLENWGETPNSFTKGTESKEFSTWLNDTSS